jgi:hypothetical protein
MTDVIEIAKERLLRLVAEIDTLDDFIRMAETLAEHPLSRSDTESDAEDEIAGRPASLATVHPYSAAAGPSRAEAAREGFFARELKPWERLH